MSLRIVSNRRMRAASMTGLTGWQSYQDNFSASTVRSSDAFASMTVQMGRQSYQDKGSANSV
ncbi:hypothetical protein DPMN_072461 [Dreissena polymorpha]|uniref:Uncharacterized protein n=1 Tax=Dreissena polymorpha TaxID=45954 RepID=A0A9D3Z9A1_DREPO|nr:hypothetical protein DPMN_072461 [Dreissena polymorpha]